MVHRLDRATAQLQLTPELLTAAYAQGMFPMAPSRHAATIQWYDPDPRAILPLEDFRVPRTLRQKLRQGVFDLRIDTAFEQVMRACAQPRRDEQETWINDVIIDAYVHLHELGLAHSVEAWRDGELVGGLYGVALHAAFFGESMFHIPGRGTDASKACLVHLVNHLRERGFQLLDVQINSEHMRSLGAIDIPRREYKRMLATAVRQHVQW
ncbi:MAG: leucyl/phenylalanyl-tRNA--protein transferase [Phycisphaeraceae bacterium]